MGRDLHWYVIPKDIQHDKTKQICLEYEFQGDEDDVNCELYKKVTNESALFDCNKRDGELSKEYYDRKKAFEDNVIHVNCDYKYDEQHRNKWCHKCHMFVTGLYNSVALLDSEGIQHSYSSLYWKSKWNIREMHLGSSDTEFVNLFRNDNLYRVQVGHDDVVYAFEAIKRLGTPLRRSDVEACEETMNILNFLENWTKNDDVYVIMEDEF
jgi:hypothetical protein